MMSITRIRPVNAVALSGGGKKLRRARRQTYRRLAYPEEEPQPLQSLR